MKQRIQWTLETVETIRVAEASTPSVEFCPQCQASVEMLSARAAAALSGASERKIFHLIENGRLHFVENERILVCRSSLTDSLRTEV